MTANLEDAQKILRLRVLGNSVISSCDSSGWMARVEAILGRDLPAMRKDGGADTAYDQSTRVGRQVETALILDT